MVTLDNFSAKGRLLSHSLLLSLFHVSLPFQYFLLQTFLGTACHSISPGAKDGDGNPKKPLGFSLSYHMEKNFIVNEGVSKSKHVPESQSLAFKVLWA